MTIRGRKASEAGLLSKSQVATFSEKNCRGYNWREERKSSLAEGGVIWKDRGENVPVKRLSQNSK